MDLSAFEASLDTHKRAIEQRLGITRYPYRTLDNITLLNRLLDLGGIAFPSQGTVLDIGCADGDFGFYLSQQGRAVDFADYPETNQNQMQMVQELARTLPGQHTTHTIDIDRGLAALDSGYSFAIALGLLYHLKNPYLFLEDLAMRAGFAAVSTRIVDGAVLPEAKASAYLVSDHELGTDNTNFWLFNSAGFTRLVERCGWRVLSRIRFGNTRTGDSSGSDAREALLLASRYSVFGNIRFTHGLNRVEFASYRWTQPRFGLECPNLAGKSLVLDYYLPPDWVEGHEIDVVIEGERIPAEIEDCRATIALPPSPKALLGVEFECRHPRQSAQLGVVLRVNGKSPINLI